MTDPAGEFAEITRKLKRRQFLGRAAAAALGVGLLSSRMLSRTGDLAAAPRPMTSRRYRIAVCGRTILARQKPGAFQLAREVGADGVEVDLGGLGTREILDSKPGDLAARQQFLDVARQLGLGIASLAMPRFHASSFAERDDVERKVRDCIDTMTAMHVKVAFLPLDMPGDLVKRPELRPRIVERLKAIAPAAEQAGVVLGLETALDAAGEARLLDEVGSPAVRSYFNFASALHHRRNLPEELRTLGRDRICQIHCPDDDGVPLQNNPHLDMPTVKQTLDAMNWSGWLVIERPRDANDARQVTRTLGANAAFLKSVFQT